MFITGCERNSFQPDIILHNYGTRYTIIVAVIMCVCVCAIISNKNLKFYSPDMNIRREIVNHLAVSFSIKSIDNEIRK